MDKYDVVIIGGGLAGLTAANLLARERLKVLVLDKSNRFGGRAISNSKNGLLMNMGPHGLYYAGEAMKTFHEFGLSLPGKNAAKSVHIHGIKGEKISGDQM